MGKVIIFPILCMRFVKEKVKQFARAKAVACSENFVVCSSGGQVKIFDKNLSLLQIITGLKYVYQCLISPDEKNILLVSIANLFYIVDLESFFVTKHTMNGKYGDNLEGRGCWSLDGKGCYFCVESKKKVKSALRIYDDIQSGEYRDLLCDKYWLTSVQAVPKRKKYLLTGYDHNTDVSYLIWYDGNIIEEFPVEGLSECNVISDVRYVENGDYCIVIGSDGTIFCTVEGTLIKNFDLQETSAKTFSFMDIFQTAHMDVEERKRIAAVSKRFGFEEMGVPEEIRDVCCSRDGQYFYVATLGNLFCINAQTNQIECEKDYPYGVEKIEQISEELLLVTTWDSVECLRIDFE